MTMTVRRRAFASVAAAALVAGGAAGFGLTEPATPAYAQALPKTPIEAPGTWRGAVCPRTWPQQGESCSGDDGAGCRGHPPRASARSTPACRPSPAEGV